MRGAGYSRTPLAKKLGFKEGFSVATINVPEDYLTLVEPMPANVSIVSEKVAGADQAGWFDLGFLAQKSSKTAD